MSKISTVTVETAKKLGLLEEEYERIITILGRTPNFTELSIFSVMWSEHCSYKNSIKYLKTLPREGACLLVGAGEENAGLVDIGDGLGCAFKIESHNHPSAIEPYQGAATGVGGIHRDIFTMGARPIAALNSLRFGEITLPHTKRLVKGVVSGIGGYGNCLGVPTIGGEVYFDACYNQNILVNAMSIGIVKKGETMSAVADGPGNPVFIVGSATGKDGIHGATFASADLTENSAEDLPAVQVGDPFQEKLLLEASLEAITTGAVVGMQDMGAAGITCSTSEMSAKSGTGMRIDLDKVPTRQMNMQAFEILLSESQERMLIVCKKGEEAKLMKVFDKWDLECQQIGEVTDTGMLEFFQHGELVAHVPAEPLVLGGGAPVYDREYEKPTYIEDLQDYNSSNVADPGNLEEALHAVFESPILLNKRWIYEQYDSMVRTNTATTNAPSDAAVIRIKENGKAIAATVDCNSSYVYADPYKGAMIAVAEAARNLVCSGAEPLAVTNNLNFGNPYNKEVYWQFVHAVKGMGEACRRFNTPVTGGNVSFYNQSMYKDRVEPIYPTPTIGMIGLIDDPLNVVHLHFESEGDLIFLLGDSKDDFNQSEYLRSVKGIKNSHCPYFDIETEYNLQASLKVLMSEKILVSAHDVAEGGLFMNLMESSFHLNKGFAIKNPTGLRDDVFLLSEAQSRVVVSIHPQFKENLTKILETSGVNFVELGHVTGREIAINDHKLGNIETWKTVHMNRLGEIIEN
ncbi:MAG: phosphoribosylformylglycinamidine synthase subunit PurL [Saprospiraceae bacterium]|nr:phosphoribosylformylglycinamidine synthase subunit PurL [Saprospiraceae bacterium]